MTAAQIVIPLIGLAIGILAGAAAALWKHGL
jgi:hypothetical protein